MILLFHQNSKHVPPIADRQVKSWLNKMLRPHFTRISVHVITMTDDALLTLNQDHLQHDYYTDIITFDLSENHHQLECELYISLDRVSENAKETIEPVKNEYLRVIAHGVLHVLGFTDKSEEDQHIMRTEENRWINQF